MTALYCIAGSLGLLFVWGFLAASSIRMLNLTWNRPRDVGNYQGDQDGPIILVFIFAPIVFVTTLGVHCARSVAPVGFPRAIVVKK